MEIWKDIPGYENLYQASNFGRIRSHPQKITSSRRFPERHWKCRVLKTKSHSYQTGYRVSLWKNGQEKDWLVARLVAMTWVAGYDEKLTVNHKDGNRFNNRAENLEWVTLKDNITHAFETGLMKFQKGIVLERNNGIKLKFRSMAEASRYLGRNPGYISGCLKIGRKAQSMNTGEKFRILEDPQCIQ